MKNKKLYKQTWNEDTIVQFESVTSQEALIAVCNSLGDMKTLKLIAARLIKQFNKDEYTTEEKKTAKRSYVATFEKTLEDYDV